MRREPLALPDRPMTWVCAGDSITQGVLHTYGQRGWVEHLQERVRWQRDRLLDLVVNAGVSGWTAPQVLAQHDWLIARHKPDVLMLALGTNDAVAERGGLASFRDAMATMIERAAASGCAVVLHTPIGVTLAGRARRPQLGEFAQAVRTLADRHDTWLVDHEAHWHAAFGGADPIAWMDDAAHPNASGQLAIARLTCETLGLGVPVDLHLAAHVPR